MTASPRKLRSLKRLLTLRQLWGWEGKKVVFTNGVFDILHAGHVDLLEKAKALGDVLIVGLNEDRSVRQIAFTVRVMERPALGAVLHDMLQSMQQLRHHDTR